jgi:hypothetical protein
MSDSASYQVALLTGQSDRCRWALSPLQQDFLASVATSEGVQVGNNFPYQTGSPDFRPSSLVKASINNAFIYIWSRSRAFRDAYSHSVLQLIARRERTIFLAGSCGLELFNNLELPADVTRKVSVFAFGPVARRRPDCVHLLVGATQDSISKRYFPAPDHVVESGHMNYLSNPTVRTLCREFIERVTRPPSDQQNLE